MWLNVEMAVIVSLEVSPLGHVRLTACRLEGTEDHSVVLFQFKLMVGEMFPEMVCVFHWHPARLYRAVCGRRFFRKLGVDNVVTWHSVFDGEQMSVGCRSVAEREEREESDATY